MIQRRRSPGRPPAKRNAATMLVVALTSFVASLGAGGLTGELTSGGASLRADEVDERLVDGLRRRRLFALAEAHCRQRLEAATLPPLDAARLTVERVRNLAEQATHLPPDKRAEGLATARRAADDYVRRHPDSSRAAAVRLQDALTLLALGELARQESEVSAAPVAAAPSAAPVAAPSAPLEDARQRIREATRLLEQLEKDVALMTALRARKPTAADEFSLDELVTLGQQVRLQQARAFRNQALCYPEGSDDRIAALPQALEPLDVVARQIGPDDPLNEPLRLERAVCLRLSGRRREARELLTADAGSPTAPPPAVRAELVRLELAEGDLDAAQRVIDAALASGIAAGGQRSGDFDFAILETYVARWQAAEKQGIKAPGATAADWQQKALAVLRQIEQSHGVYWRRRGELLLVRAAGAEGSANVELLTRSADNLFLQNQWDEAIAAYEKAATLLASPGELERRFELLQRAAVVEQKRGRHGEAARRLRELATAHPKLAKAQDAHLLAAWNQAQQARLDAAAAASASPPKSPPPNVAPNAVALAAYVAILREHLTVWPQGRGADQARVWLGAFHESRRQWDEAIAAYRGVAPTAAAPSAAPSAAFETALAALARCWPLRLAELRSQPAAAARAADDAAAFLEAALRDSAGAWRRDWKEADRAAALTLARIRLEHLARPIDYAAADDLLQAALQAADAPPAWKSAVQTLRIVAIAGQSGRGVDASKQWESLAGGSALELLELLESLGRLANPAGAEAGPAATGAVSPATSLRLAVVDRLTPKRAELSEPDRTRFDLARGETLAAAGRRADALKAFEQLAQRLPNSASVQERFAALLLEGGDAATLRRALDQWRVITSRTPPRTPAWYQAKYNVALAQYRLGEKQAAAQMIRYLLETPPGLDGSPLKPQFVDLLGKCGR